jgi:hypothetical protein
MKKSLTKDEVNYTKKYSKVESNQTFISSKFMYNVISFFKLFVQIWQNHKHINKKKPCMNILK